MFCQNDTLFHCCDTTIPIPSGMVKFISTKSIFIIHQESIHIESILGISIVVTAFLGFLPLLTSLFGLGLKIKINKWYLVVVMVFMSDLILLLQVIFQNHLQVIESVIFVMGTSLTSILVTINLFNIVVREVRARRIIGGVLGSVWIILPLPNLWLYAYSSTSPYLLNYWHNLVTGLWELFCMIYNSSVTFLIAIEIIRIFRKKYHIQVLRDNAILILSDNYLNTWIKTNLGMVCAYIILFTIKTQSLVFYSDHIQEFVRVLLRVLVVLNSVLSIYILDRFPLIIMTMRSFKKNRGAVTTKAFQNEMIKSAKSKDLERARRTQAVIGGNPLSSIAIVSEIEKRPALSPGRIKSALRIETNHNRSNSQVIYLTSKQGLGSNRSVTVKSPLSSPYSSKLLPSMEPTPNGSGRLPGVENVSGILIPGESESRLPTIESVLVLSVYAGQQLAKEVRDLKVLKAESEKKSTTKEPDRQIVVVVHPNVIPADLDRAPESGTPNTGVIYSIKLS
jgi:hypothetical protein